MMTASRKYDKLAGKLFEAANTLDKAAEKLDATAATLAQSTSTMKSQRLVSTPQMHLLSPSLQHLASRPTLNYRPISVPGESSITTLPPNATDKEQKAYAEQKAHDALKERAEYMSRKYEPTVENLREDLALAQARSFAKDDGTERGSNYSRSRLGGKKITNKTKKRSYKKSKRSYKKSKRGGATAPITFTIVKGNSDELLLEVQLQSNQTGKDLYEQVNQWLDQHPDMLTDAEKVGQRKLVTDNDVEVIYTDNLSKFQSPTKLILSIIPEGSSRRHGRGQGPAPVPAPAGV